MNRLRMILVLSILWLAAAALPAVAVVGGSIVTGNATATGSVDPAAVTQAINWLSWLFAQPWAWMPVVTGATAALRKLVPILAQHKLLTRGAALVLSVLAGFLTVAAGGDLSGFGVEQALYQLGEALLIFLGATGLYKMAPGKPAYGPPAT